MRVLGIDPGYERLGIAVLETGHKPELIFSECFKTSTKDLHSERLAKIQKELEKIIKKYKPEILGVETLFFNKNIKTAIKVAEARGIILATAQINKLKIQELSPQQIKIAVTGYGKSDKKAIMKMIPMLVDLKQKTKMLDDEFDAIAASIAINPKLI